MQIANKFLVGTLAERGMIYAAAPWLCTPFIKQGYPDY
jgi:hypothetical protein